MSLRLTDNFQEAGTVKDDHPQKLELKAKQQVNFLIELSREVTLFHDELKKAYARFKVDDHHEIWPITHRNFKLWLTNNFYKKTSKVPSEAAIRQALDQIEYYALFQGEEHRLSVRVAKKDNIIWYDLADEKWRAIKISPKGWEIVDNPPILFQRNANTAPQITPRSSNDGLHKIFNFINLRNTDEQILLLVSIVASLIPDISRALMVFHGEKGAAKSTSLRVLRKLIDPAHAELLTMPTKTDDLVVQLSKNYMPVYDNLDKLTVQQSDAICRAITGDGIIKRQLYTDNDEFITSYRRCIAINGINLVVTKPDLVDRSVIFELERISEENRKQESDLWNEFDNVKAEIVGHMFNTLSRALALYPQVVLKEAPRMADYSKWGVAIAEALEIGGTDFLNAYRKNRERANLEIINDNPLAMAIMYFLDEFKGEWEGTVAALHQNLETIADVHQLNKKSKSWPKAPNRLTLLLNTIRSNLNDIGITYSVSSSTKSEIKNHRVITLQKQQPMDDDLNVGQITVEPLEEPNIKKEQVKGDGLVVEVEIEEFNKTQDVSEKDCASARLREIASKLQIGGCFNVGA